MLFDAQGAGIEVDISPAEAERLAPAEAEHEYHDVEGVEAVVLSCGKQVAGLVDGECVDFGGVGSGAGHVDEFGDVPGDKAPSLRLAMDSPALVRSEGPLERPTAWRRMVSCAEARRTNDVW